MSKFTYTIHMIKKGTGTQIIDVPLAAGNQLLHIPEIDKAFHIADSLQKDQPHLISVDVMEHGNGQPRTIRSYPLKA